MRIAPASPQGSARSDRPACQRVVPQYLRATLAGVLQAQDPHGRHTDPLVVVGRDAQPGFSVAQDRDLLALCVGTLKFAPEFYEMCQ
ncbi:hypothetical protein GCM10010254_22540 [Streptomyces chromofuscus]|nr:hypothetical protein GCM10010254_22540 [Streptomyces chromofuscus]